MIVSNRVASPADLKSRAGGLAVALRDALRQRGGLWFGWSGRIAEGEAGPTAVERLGRLTFVTTDLAAADHEAFYVAAANRMLWPLCHDRPNLVEYRRSAWKGYLEVNERFARALLPHLESDDRIWIHDYHFFPLATFLRRLGVRQRLGFFLHIPFPPPELLEILPVHEELVDGLLDYDLVGMQTDRDVAGLTRHVVERRGGRLQGDVLTLGERHTHVGAFPIGIDFERFARLAGSATAAATGNELRASLPGSLLAVGVDRLDYSKGLSRRFRAFEELLARRPAGAPRLTLLQIAPHSRGVVSEYRTLRRELEQISGQINGRFAESDWMPLRYLNRTYSQERLAAIYRVGRIGLVTPQRDGMNLVAKEFVASQDPRDPGVLVLSSFAGAATELTDALLVHPYDLEGMADALEVAISMPLGERRERWQGMKAALERNSLERWRDRFLQALDRSSPRVLR